MGIKLTPELMRQLLHEEETDATADELKQARIELLREKAKTEQARRAHLQPKPPKQPPPEKGEKVPLAVYVALFGNLLALVGLAIIFLCIP